MSSLLYADPSFLFSLYQADQHTAKALDFTKIERQILVSDLAEFELMQAVRLLMFQHGCQHTTGIQREAGLRILTRFNQDVIDVYHRQPCEWTKVFQRANELSSVYTREEGHRSMDLLHLAIAGELRLKTFLTFDKKQRALAETLGFETKI